MSDVVKDGPLTMPTWEKYVVIARAVANMEARQKRKFLSYIRPDNSADLFVPRAGLTLAEFAVFYLAHEKVGRPKKPTARSRTRTQK